MSTRLNTLRVSDIITVPRGILTRVDGANTKTLEGIIVNLVDYNIGATKYIVNTFDDSISIIMLKIFNRN